MRKKPAIPDVPLTNDFTRARFDFAIKDIIELIIGRKGSKIERIDTTNLVGTEKILANKINEILELLQ